MRAYPAAGWLGARAGLPVTFAVLADVAGVATALAVRAWPAEDPDALRHTHGPLSHNHPHVHDEHHRHWPS